MELHLIFDGRGPEKMDAINSVINHSQSMSVWWQLTFWIWLSCTIVTATWWWKDIGKNVGAQVGK